MGIYFLLTSPTHLVDLMCSSASVNRFHFKLLPFRERYLLWNLGKRTLTAWLFSWISKSLDHSWNVRLDCSIKAWKVLSCGNKNDSLWVFIGRIIIIIIGTGIVKPMPEAMVQHRNSGTVKPPVKTPNRKRILVSFNNLKNIFASFDESRRGFYIWLFLLLILSTCAGLDLIFSHGKIISACLKIYVSFAFALFIFFSWIVFGIFISDHKEFIYTFDGWDVLSQRSFSPLKWVFPKSVKALASNNLLCSYWLSHSVTPDAHCTTPCIFLQTSQSVSLKRTKLLGVKATQRGTLWCLYDVTLISLCCWIGHCVYIWMSTPWHYCILVEWFQRWM